MWQPVSCLTLAISPEGICSPSLVRSCLWHYKHQSFVLTFQRTKWICARLSSNDSIWSHTLHPSYSTDGGPLVVTNWVVSEYQPSPHTHTQTSVSNFPGRGQHTGMNYHQFHPKSKTEWWIVVSAGLFRVVQAVRMKRWASQSSAAANIIPVFSVISLEQGPQHSITFQALGQKTEAPLWSHF